MRSRLTPCKIADSAITHPTNDAQKAKTEVNETSIFLTIVVTVSDVYFYLCRRATRAMVSEGQMRLGSRYQQRWPGASSHFVLPALACVVSFHQAASQHAGFSEYHAHCHLMHTGDVLRRQHDL